jgi:hypothetical protein
MARSIYSIPEVMARIDEITDAEESRYSDIPGWDDTVLQVGDKAVKIKAGRRGKSPEEIWMPLSQLRKAHDCQSVYASVWILDQKGLG